MLASVSKDSNGSINDAKLVKLVHRTSRDAATAGEFTYDVLGDEVTHNVNAGSLSVLSTSAVQANVTVLPIANLLPTKHFGIAPKPSAALVLDYMFQGECPFSCEEGYLPTLADLVGKIPGYTSQVTLENRPVCPSCMGVTLCQEQQDLKLTLEQFLTIDIVSVHEWFGRLSIRREQLGYRYIQFDEREWGFLFDDMMSDDGGDDDGNADQYEQWDEAMDPNAGVVTRPASKETVQALPRKVFGQMKAAHAGTECLVCRDAFMDDTVVVELPCGHCFCEDGCAEQWLKQWDTCPACRRQVTAVDQEKAEVVVQEVEVGSDVSV